MKNILMMILGVGLALGATAAQPKLASGARLGGGRPAKVIVVRPVYRAYGYAPYGFGYNPLYAPYYAYNPFYSPFAYQRYQSELDLQIDQINNDYHHEIAGVRHDKTLSKAERRQTIRDLRHEKANSIIEAKKDYFQSKEKDTE